MCVGGGGGTPSSKGNPNRDGMKADPNPDPDVWSEGTLGGGGGSYRKDGPASYWKNNPGWDEQWYEKGYKKGDWVSTKNQSDRNYGS